MALDQVHIGLGLVPPQLNNNGYGQPNCWVVIWTAMKAALWYKVYDLVEFFYDRAFHGNSEEADNFRRLVNEFFQENGYAFRLTAGGDLEYRGEEPFESAVQTAKLSLTDAGFTTAQTELHEALEDLAKRPMPDLTGAVQHAMAGLECAAKQIASEPKLELGKILKKNPNLYPPPLGDVITQLYGYASNNGRHLTEGGEPDFAEAELLVGIAAITATYLARKSK